MALMPLTTATRAFRLANRGPPWSQRRISLTATLFLQSAERFLYAVEMRMLAAAHSLVFGALQRPFISLPISKNGKLLAYRNVGRLDYVHRPPEASRWIETCITEMHLIHDKLHMSLSCCGSICALFALLPKHRFSPLPQFF